MVTVIIVAIAVHVLAGVFWAGTTFVLARNPEATTPGIARAQMGAALVAIVAGATLWSLVRPPAGSTLGRILAAGAGCALLAAALQTTLSVSSRLAWTRRLMVQRIAAGLLAVAILSMAVARYA
jgi:hypothetical protein